MSSRLFLAAVLGLVLSTPAGADQRDPALDPLFDELRSGEGDAGQIQGQIESLWRAAPETGVEVLVDRVVEALDRRDPETAGALAARITALSPHYAEGWRLAGDVAMLRGDQDAARTAFARTVDLEPRHYLALTQLGDLAMASGDPEQAYQLYQRALQWNPRLSEVERKARLLAVTFAGQEI